MELILLISASSEHLKSLLHNPHLQEMLRDLDGAGDDVAAKTERAMKEPIFVEFADACLSTVEPERYHSEGQSLWQI